MPAGMPIRSAITIAIDASCIVTGSFCAIRLSTGTLMRSDWPKSPDRTPFAQYKYCTGIARQQMLQRKDQDRHEEKRRDQLDDALGEEAQHGSVRFPGAAQRATMCCRTGIHVGSVVGP